MRIVSSHDIYRDDLARVINPYRALEIIREHLLEGRAEHIFGLDGLLREIGVTTAHLNRGRSLVNSVNFVNFMLDRLRGRLVSGSLVLLADHHGHIDAIPVVNGVAQQPAGGYLQEMFFREMARLRESERSLHNVIPQNRPELELEDYEALRNEMNQRRFEYFRQNAVGVPLENNDDNFESGSEPEIEYIEPPEMVRPLDAAPSYEEAVEYDPPPYSLVDPLENNDADFDSGSESGSDQVEYIEPPEMVRPLDVLPSYEEAVVGEAPSYEEAMEYERPPYLLGDPLENNNFDFNSDSESDSGSDSGIESGSDQVENDIEYIEQRGSPR